MNKKSKTIQLKKILIVFLFGTIISILIFLSCDIYKSSKETAKEIVTEQTKRIELASKKEPIVVKVGRDINETIVLNFRTETEETKEEITKIQKENEYIAKIEIPSAGINENVLSETSTGLMELGLNKYWGADPNQIGNCCIIGHNYKNGKQFGKLKKVKCGDLVYLTDIYNTTLKYQVYDIYTISPENTDCTSQLTNGKKEITLITCTNAGKNRLIVKARGI